MNFFDPSSLNTLLMIDFSLVLICAGALLFLGNLSFLHPGFVYLVYHFYCYTFRLWAVIDGAQTMYEDVARYGYEAVTLSELGRAMVWMDVALVCFTLGCLAATWRNTSRNLTPNKIIRLRPIIINKGIALKVCLICFPIGLFFFLVKRGALEVEIGDIGETSYASVMTMWPMACVGIGIYLWGFRWYLICAMLVYVGIVAMQGYHRFMALLPLVMMLNILLIRNNKKWPSLPFIIIAAGIFAVFPYLKYIGRAFNEGDMRMLNTLITQGSKDVLSFKNTTSVDFLDQGAAVMTLIDRQGKIYWGSNYAALLVYPVPRKFWPDKPRFTQYMFDIATPQRPIDKDGRIPTYVGEAYANFREPGIVLIAVLMGFILCSWYFTSVSYPHDSLRRFLYIIFAPALIQVWRDGLSSLVMFTIIHLTPVMFIAILHLFPSLRGSPSMAPSEIPMPVRRKFSN